MTLLEVKIHGRRITIVLENVSRIINSDGFARLVYTNGHADDTNVKYDQLMEILHEKCGSTMIDASGL